MVGHIRRAVRPGGRSLSTCRRHVSSVLPMCGRTFRSPLMESRPSLWVVGTFDTKADELLYLAQLIRANGIPVVTVDISTQGHSPEPDVPAQEVASWHERGAGYVL